MSRPLFIITRNSPLALWQAHYVQRQLQHYYPQITFQIKTTTTLGDRLRGSLSHQGGKGLFVKNLQTILLNGEADIAVHSTKDMSAWETEGLCVPAFIEREDPRDVFLSEKYAQIEDLPRNACLGTSSPRRQAYLHANFPSLKVTLLRGNINTRLKRLISGDYDAIILAAAGLKRLGLMHHISSYFDPSQLVPAIAQGVMGVECRCDDEFVKELLKSLDHQGTRYCVMAERAVNRQLKGDCFTPLGAYAQLKNNQIEICGMLGDMSTYKIVHAFLVGALNQPEELGTRLGEQLQASLRSE